ncbi:MAG TPA: hypothetical protein VG204_07055 [Terriglobia bacterium]|nr:hypothetical protein [Terriglobia bacterium]
MKTDRIGTLLTSCLLLGWVGTPSRLLAQNIQVTSTNPNSAPQGTINLNVAVGGSGFKNGAKAAFFLSGTTNPDGVTINSTTFNSSSQVTANINISDTTNIADFDIQVTNSDGRTGKGSHLFAVTAKGTPVGCNTLGTPSSFTLVTTLNYLNSSGAPQYQPHLGVTMQVRPVVLTAGSQTRTVLVAAVGSGNNSGRMEFFFVDPGTGDVLDGTVVVGSQVQPHITVQFDPTATIGARMIGAGDVNGDGIPDFVIGDFFNNAAIVFLGSENASGILSYNFTSISPPASNPGNYGSSVAMGKLDSSSAGDSVVVGATGSGGRKGMPGVVYVYRFNGSGFDLIGAVDDPLLNDVDQFGSSVAVGDVTGSSVPDLIVGAQGASVGSASAAGILYVFPSPLTSTFNYTLTAGIAGDNLGFQVSSGVLSSSAATDVIATTSWGKSVTNPRALIFSGPITGNRTASSFDFLPYPGLAGGWATHIDTGDMTGSGRVEVLVGAPNATNSTNCTNVGAAHLYLSNPLNPSQPTLAIFQPPTAMEGLFGFGMAVAPFTFGNLPLLLVGANAWSLGGANAGQVFVYKKN